MAFARYTSVDYTAVDAQTATAAQKALPAAVESNQLYSETAVDAFEAYLAEQLATKTVDADANLALLKLYLVFPARASADKIASVLFKNATALPSTSFLGASAIVPESFREDANVKQILEAGLLLQACRFEEFWQAELPFAAQVAGFTDAVRAFIVDVLRKSHSVLSTAVLQAALGVSDKEVAALVDAEQWTREGELLHVTPSDDNQMRPKKVQETLALDDVLKVVHTLSR
ncbi:hypothetical protein P43SY_003229 [Pythium insidiosum]|uniref:Eukaryotic translation initiation factor 3 subunit K n=1 Tax=Pythium insidiosum TaxID=114742 RepID=A0AAD5LNP8_PYTIN|nr:hypothetical protein P43SY_003229 [Pythium insidiosum]